jgi:translin
VGELRRYILDSLRRDDFSRCEELLTIMDEIYGILLAMDFPELLAHGLRRTTDAVRGIIERTRGDLTVALGQKKLQTKLDGLG